MRIFICWSGDRSKLVARELDGWLKLNIQAVEPWYSEEIQKGAKWRQQISEILEKCNFGIICVTPENQTAPWLLFEAGALSKLPQAHVCTFLLDIEPADVRDPLAQFQHTSILKDQFAKLIRDVNTALNENNERPLAHEVLQAILDKEWEPLEQRLNKIKKMTIPDTPATKRDTSDILREVLELMRGQDKAITEIRQFLKYLPSAVPPNMSMPGLSFQVDHMTMPASGTISLEQLRQSAKSNALWVEDPPEIEERKDKR